MPFDRYKVLKILKKRKSIQLRFGGFKNYRMHQKTKEIQERFETDSVWHTNTNHRGER